MRLRPDPVHGQMTVGTAPMMVLGRRSRQRLSGIGGANRSFARISCGVHSAEPPAPESVGDRTNLVPCGSPVACRGHHDLVLENMALRQQLQMVQRAPRPRLRIFATGCPCASPHVLFASGDAGVHGRFKPGRPAGSLKQRIDTCTSVPLRSRMRFDCSTPLFR
jgi:hypothetical protein